MASQAPFFSSLIPINNKTHSFRPQPTNFFTFRNSKIPFSKTEPSQENEPERQNPEEDPIKLAFAKARSYKNTSIQSNAPTKINFESPVEELVSGRNIEGLTSDNESKNTGDSKEIPLAVKIAMEKAKEYKKNKSVVGIEATSSHIVQNSENNEKLKSGEVINNGGGGKEVPLAVKIALGKAKEYKKNRGVVGTEATGSTIVQNSEKNEILKSDEVIKNDGGVKEVPLAVKIALDKANEYKKNKGVVNLNETSDSGLKGGNVRTFEEKKSTKNEELNISSIDFVGLNFSDKKIGRGLPAGLVPISDPFPEGNLPEVEILVGDKSKFGNSEQSSTQISIEENDLDKDLYKPKVTTWGLFPRPNDISKAYGGGRTLSPGEALETAEEKAAKEAKTKKLLAAYKKKYGLNIDPKLKSDCEKALNDGDSLMDLGQLKEALPFYEKVMENLPFQSELHGLAALQWSICLDSLSRSSEARVMYEKLQSHPIPKVSKKARQLVFGFQAMEMMKVTTSLPRNPFTGYQNYFDAFVVKDKADFTLKDAEEDEGALSQALPYVIFLLASPILMVLLIAASRSRTQAIEFFTSENQA